MQITINPCASCNTLHIDTCTNHSPGDIPKAFMQSMSACHPARDCDCQRGHTPSYHAHRCNLSDPRLSHTDLVFPTCQATFVGTEAHFPIAGTEARSPIAWKSEHTPTRVHQLPSDFAAIVHHAFSTPAVRSVHKLQTLSGCCKAWSPYCVLEHAFLVRTAWLQRTRQMQSC